MKTGLIIALGLVFGVVFERYHVCLSSAITDVFLYGGTRKLKGLLAAIPVSAVLFSAAIALGIVEPATMPLLPATLLAGVVFGVGMNLAGGCVSGTLFKVAQGYLASWVAFTGLGLGFGVMELVASYLAPSFVFGGDERHWQGMTLPRALGIPSLPFAALVTGVALLGYWAWRRSKEGPRKRGVLDGSSPVAGGALIALLNTVYFVLAAHPLTLVSLTSIPFVIGAFISARAVGRFRFRVPVRKQALRSLVGGLLMGASTSAMMGCNVTHVLGGVPQFGLGSLVATAGIVGGAWLGARLALRVADRS